MKQYLQKRWTEEEMTKLKGTVVFQSSFKKGVPLPEGKCFIEGLNKTNKQIRDKIRRMIQNVEMND